MASSPSSAAPRWDARTWALLVVLCGVLFLDGLDVSMVGMALPSIRSELGLTTSQLQWVVSGYVLGYGGLLLQANEWANREATLKSYELLARYVMPRFQGSLVGIESSYNRSVAHSQELFAERTAAMEKAHQTFEQKAGTPV